MRKIVFLAGRERGSKREGEGSEGYRKLKFETIEGLLLREFAKL